MRPGDEGGGGATASGITAVDSDEDPISFTGGDVTHCHFEDLGMQQSVNQAAFDGFPSQVERNMDWPDGESVQFVPEIEDFDSDHYEDFLVRCEGDSDVEEIFPLRMVIEESVDERRTSAEISINERCKNAKQKADMSRKAKQRASEGVVAVVDDVSYFSDGASEDCRELTDSSDDDGVVDPNSVFVTKRKSRSGRLAKRVYYDETRCNAHEQFQLKLCFSDVHEYRRALTNYHIVHQRDFEYLRNDHDRITVCCKEEGTCPFAIMSSTIEGESTHVIRGLVLPHTCGNTNNSSRINSVWLAKTYENHIRSDPQMKISALIEMVMREYRAKNRALEAVDGHHETQYHKLRDYLQTVLNTNPGSRCIVQTIVNTDPKKNPRFHQLFFCLNAQVKGFLEGCRPYIGVDGCFLKQGTGFQILAATARDGNDNMYPLTFGVVGKEETATWCWFLTQLRYALGGGISRHGPFTFMSDCQRGLLSAISQVFPECEQRFCLRHIYANFQLAGFRGEDLKKLLDAAAYAFTHSEHISAMEMLREENLDAWNWINKIPTKHWACHAMDNTCKTDLVVNNWSEVFNSYILEQRDKPIVTMIEQIRTRLMAKFAVKREGAASARWEITPHYVEKIETEKRYARFCTAVNAGNDIWQVETTHYGEKVVHPVNLRDHTCGCKKWDLTGVPCKHAISATYKARQFPEDYISEFFKKPMYDLAYNEMIYPVPGQHDWVKTDTLDIEPPQFHSKPGRKKKKRRPSAGEGSDGTGRLTTITCSNCKLKGHRYTTCATTLKPHLAARKAGHQSKRQLPEYMTALAPPAPRRQAPAPSPAPPAPSPPPPAPRRQAPAPSPAPPAPRRQAPYAPPRQGSTSASRQKFPPLRGRGRASGYYRYFTASNGQGGQGI